MSDCSSALTECSGMVEWAWCYNVLRCSTVPGGGLTTSTVHYLKNKLRRWQLTGEVVKYVSCYARCCVVRYASQCGRTPACATDVHTYMTSWSLGLVLLEQTKGNACERGNKKRQIQTSGSFLPFVTALKHGGRGRSFVTFLHQHKLMTSVA